MAETPEIVARFKAELAGQVVVITSGGLLVVVLARLLGPEDYGLLFYAISVLGVLSVLSQLGLAKSCARYIAEFKERDPRQVPHVLRTTFGVNLLLVAVVGGGLVLAHGHLAQLLGEPAIAPLLALGAVYLALESLATFVRMTLQGFEEIQASATLYALDRGLRLVCAVGLVALGAGVVGAMVGYLVGFGAAVVLGLSLIYRRHYRNSPRSPAVADGLRRRILAYTVPLTATGTANVLDKRMDTVIVGVLLSPVAVSYYVLGKQLVEFIETPMTALGFTLSPTFGARKAAGDVDRAARLYERALATALVVYVPAAAGVVLVAPLAIDVVFGAGYGGAVPVVQVLALYIVFQSVTKLTSNGLDYLGRARHRAIAKGVTAVMNVGLTVALVPVLGVVGAAVATVGTYGLYTAATLAIVDREFELRRWFLLERVGWVLLVTAAMTLAVLPALRWGDGPLTLVVAVVAGGVTWLVLSGVTGLIDVAEMRTVLT